MIRTRTILTITGLAVAPLALGCLLEISPRPGSDVVPRTPRATTLVVVVVEAGAELDAGPNGDGGAVVEAGAEASVDSGGGD